MTVTLVTPNMLADALESGDYKRYRTQLSSGPNGKSNCCLGVACRIAGVDLTDAWGEPNHLRVAPDLLPWLGSEESPYGTTERSLRSALISLNDSTARGVNWKTTTIPLLRAVKVNKDGSLSKRQPEMVKRVLGRSNSLFGMRDIIKEYAS